MSGIDALSLGYASLSLGYSACTSSLVGFQSVRDEKTSAPYLAKADGHSGSSAFREEGRGSSSQRSERRTPEKAVYLDDQRPIDVRDRFADPSANAMYGGPTAIDFSMLPTRQLVPRSEAKSLKAWQAQDLSQYYREIHRRDL